MSLGISGKREGRGKKRATSWQMGSVVAIEHMTTLLSVATNTKRIRSRAVM